MMEDMGEELPAGGGANARHWDGSKLSVFKEQKKGQCLRSIVDEEESGSGWGERDRWGPEAAGIPCGRFNSNVLLHEALSGLPGSTGHFILHCAPSDPVSIPISGFFTDQVHLKDRTVIYYLCASSKQCLARHKYSSDICPLMETSSYLV